MIDQKKGDMESNAASGSVLEKETPKKRGRPRKVRAQLIHHLLNKLSQSF